MDSQRVRELFTINGLGAATSMAKNSTPIATISMTAYRYSNEISMIGTVENLAKLMAKAALQVPFFEEAFNLAILQIREEKAKAAQQG